MSRYPVKNRLLAVLLIAALVTLALPAPLFSSPGPELGAAAEASGARFLVKFKPGTPAESIAEINRSTGAIEHDRIPRLDVRVLEAPRGARVGEVVERYRRNPNVAFAEPDVVLKATSITPNDAYWPYQRSELERIAAPQGWAITSGSGSVTIAILDSGVNVSHPEFAGRLAAGYDFVNSDADPSDDFGHGTMVAGIAAATGNNAIGVAGIDWQARIMPVKVLGASGAGYSSVIAKGIVWAADQGARVINMSFGSSYESSTLKSAVEYAASKNVVMVAAAGNESTATVDYPAANPNVIAVSATRADQLASFSSYGPEVEVCAPGSMLYTTTMVGGYGYCSGTSAAAPVVAGLASLALSADPSLDAAAVRERIRATATDLGEPGWDPQFGHGRVNISAALSAGSAGSTSQPPVPEPDPITRVVVDTTAPAVRIISPAANAVVSGKVAISASAEDEGGISRVDCYVDGVLLGSATTSPCSFTWDTTKVANGTHTIAVLARDAAGNSASAQVAVTVSNETRTRPPKKR